MLYSSCFIHLLIFQPHLSHTPAVLRLLILYSFLYFFLSSSFFSPSLLLLSSTLSLLLSFICSLFSFPLNYYFLFSSSSFFSFSVSDRGILIWDGIRKKDKDRESLDPAVLYSQAALPIASEAIGLFRFLLSSSGWRDIVEQELLRPLVQMSQKLEENTVRKYGSRIFYFT